MFRYIFLSAFALLLLSGCGQSVGKDVSLYNPDLNEDCSLCDLRGAELSFADLTGAKLNIADLAGADLRGADLTRANLNGADMEGADLYEVIGADFNGARGWIR
jgi:uncharacterized protein YjbI with pentapeptide repeats